MGRSLSEKPKKRAQKKRAGKDVQAGEPVASAKPDKKKPAAKKRVKKSATKKNAKQVAAKKVAAKKAAAKKPSGETKRPKPEHKSKTESDETVAAGVDPFEVAKQTMKGSMPAIVATMVRKAKEGSCTHAKTLLEMTGAKHMFDGEAEGQVNGEPWAKLVLERLDEAESGKDQEAAGE